MEDDGPGIAEDLAPHVFKAFRRSTNTTHAVTGSGLGLAVVSAIARAHSGQASLQSTDKGGSRFFLKW